MRKKFGADSRIVCDDCSNFCDLLEVEKFSDDCKSFVILEKFGDEWKSLEKFGNLKKFGDFT